MSLDLQTLITELLPATCAFRLTKLTIAEASVRHQLTATAPTACCPGGTAPSSAVHSRSQRHLMDLPWGTRAGHHQRTVRKFFCRNPTCARRLLTERLPDLVAPSARVLTPSLPDLIRRWRESQADSVQLWREMQALSYTPSVRTVCRFITQLRRAADAGPPPATEGSPYTRRQGPSARAVSCLMVCAAAKRSADGQTYLDQLCQVEAGIARAHGLTHAFLTMVRERRGRDLEAWITAATDSGIDVP